MNKERVASLIYQRVVLPATAPFCEPTHRLTLIFLKWLQNSERFLRRMEREFCLKRGPEIKIDAWEIEFPNPFLLAAGMDKNAEAIAALATFGMGGIEVGSLTLRPRKGNPPRRIKRFSDGTIINWMGLPNVGAVKARENWEETRRKASLPVGINIAVTPEIGEENANITDLKQTLNLTYPLRPDWITLNVSCPNVEAPANREQKMKEIEELIRAFREISEALEKRWGFRVPRLIKIGPDMGTDEIKRMVELVKENNCDGVVATNTTTDRTGSRKKYACIPQGGLSGPLLFEKSLQTVKQVRECDQELGGKRLVIIACGGIDSFEKWKQMERAGADLCQILTGFITQGPYFFQELNKSYCNHPN